MAFSREIVPVQGRQRKPTVLVAVSEKAISGPGDLVPVRRRGSGGQDIVAVARGDKRIGFLKQHTGFSLSELAVNMTGLNTIFPAIVLGVGERRELIPSSPQEAEELLRPQSRRLESVRKALSLRDELSEDPETLREFGRQAVPKVTGVSLFEARQRMPVKECPPTQDEFDTAELVAAHVLEKRMLGHVEENSKEEREVLDLTLRNELDRYIGQAEVNAGRVVVSARIKERLDKAFTGTFPILEMSPATSAKMGMVLGKAWGLETTMFTGGARVFVREADEDFHIPGPDGMEYYRQRSKLLMVQKGLDPKVIGTVGDVALWPSKANYDPSERVAIGLENGFPWGFPIQKLPKIFWPWRRPIKNWLLNHGAKETDDLVRGFIRTRIGDSAIRPGAVTFYNNRVAIERSLPVPDTDAAERVFVSAVRTIMDALGAIDSCDREVSSLGGGSWSAYASTALVAPRIHQVVGPLAKSIIYGEPTPFNKTDIRDPSIDTLATRVRMTRDQAQEILTDSATPDGKRRLWGLALATNGGDRQKAAKWLADGQRMASRFKKQLPPPSST